MGKASQAITLTSSPPTLANVGAEAYVVSATTSSGLAVSFSSATPPTCSLRGSNVRFLQGGVCTIDANQTGNADYAAAPQVQQSIEIQAPTPSSPTSQPPPLSPLSTDLAAPVPLRPSLLPLPTPTPDSAFRMRADPTVDQTTGAITFEVSVVDPGALRWLLTFQNGPFGAFAARATTCRSGDIELRGRCRPKRIVFAQSTIAVGAIDATGTPVPAAFTAIPSASAKRALDNARRSHRALVVTALLSFESSRGGEPTSQTRSITVALYRRR